MVFVDGFLDIQFWMGRMCVHAGETHNCTGWKRSERRCCIDVDWWTFRLDSGSVLR
jgi:hypothetical protein